MKTPMLSIVIPTLEEAKYLHIAMESLKAQTFKNFEIIVIDGGSKDNTVKLAKKYTDNVFVSEGANVVLARDLGVRKAKGEIIVGVDADSFYPVNYLETVYNLFYKKPEIVAVTGKIIFNYCPWWWQPIWWLSYSLFEIVYRLTGYILYAPALHLAFRKSAFYETGGYNTKLDFGGDEMDFLSKLRKIGKIEYIWDPIPLANSRRIKLGFIRFLFVHLLYGYWLNFFTAKMLGKAIIRAKPVR